MARIRTRSLFFGCLWLLTACSAGTSSSPGEQPGQSQKVATDQALQSFSVDQTFWSWVRKSAFDGKRIVSLVFSKSGPSSLIKSALVAHTLDGQRSEIQSLPNKYTVLDFDVAPSGRLIQIAYAEVENRDQGFDLPLKELTVFEDSKKLFVFNDSKLNQAIQYAADGTASPSKPFADDRTLFLTSWPLTRFARVKAANDRIYISAYGTFGYKVFEFDRDGRELSQAEILPKTAFNSILVDEDAPFLELQGDTLYAAITTSEDDQPIIKRHLGIDLDLKGPLDQILLQSFDDRLVRKTTAIVKGTDDTSVLGLSVSPGYVAVFGDSGGAGHRKAFAAVLTDELKPVMHSEFTIERESSVYAAAFLGRQLLVAGSTGSSQVSTGSVVVPSDAFISAIDFGDGTTQRLSEFGTNRDDRITAILTIGDKLYVSGNTKGPITHTADTDSSQGYQDWFVGEVRR